MEIILILAGLALAIVSLAIYAKNIRSRQLLNTACAGFGLTLAGVFGLSETFAGAPAIVIGLTAWGMSAWALLWPFPVGKASVYQPEFFRDPNSPLNPAEWLVMMPGRQMFLDFFCRLVATLEIGRLAFERDAEVRFPEGLANVTFRIDAELPLDRVDLLGRFVQSVPSGTPLTDAEGRTAYIKDRLTALMKQVLEATVEQLSAYTADALELQAVAEGNNPHGFDYLQDLAYRAEELLGLPAEGWDEQDNLVPRFRVEIIDIVLGPDLKTNLANRAINDSITEKAIAQLTAKGMPEPERYRLALRAKQIRDAEFYDAMGEAEFADVSKEARVIELENEFASMLSDVDYKEALDKDTSKSKATEKIEALVAYKKKYAAAKSAPKKAMAEELRYRNESIIAENANLALGDAVLAADPNRVKLADRHERELAEYAALYGQEMKEALDQVAAGIDTSRFSVKGLEGLGGATGIEALRLLRSRKGGAA